MSKYDQLISWDRRENCPSKSYQGFNKIILNTCNTGLQFVLGRQLLVLLDQGVDAVNHLLDELHLGVAESVLVGDVVSDA